MVVVWLTAGITLTIFVVDVGNWFSHRRHLQMAADAAALAGGDSFAPTCNSATNATIEDYTRRYGGPDALHPSEPYNRQIGGTPADKIHLLINAIDSWDKGGHEFTDGPADHHPCATGFVDVKLTEAPNGFLSFFGTIEPTINAHARVELKQEQTSAGALPVAVPNPRPKSGLAIFVDEASNNSIVTTPSGGRAIVSLVEGTQSGGVTPWTSDQVSFSIPSARVGVVIALSGKTTVATSGLTLAQICAQTLVTCYDSTANPPSNGLGFIRGWSSSGSGAQTNPPLLRDVELFYNGGCSDPYFSSAATTCSVGIEARVDAGGLATSSMAIRAFGAGCPTNGNNAGCPLTPDSNQTGGQCAALAGSGTCWRSDAIPIPSGAGALPLTMTWKETAGTVNGNNCTNGQGCGGSFQGGATIQRSFSAIDTASGPIKAMTIYKCDGISGPGCAGGVFDVQSFQIGTTHAFSVAIGIAGALQNATSVNEPAVALRVVNSNGSQTQSLDCTPPNTTSTYSGQTYSTLWEELAYGCGPEYTINSGSPDCSTIGPSTLWDSNQPWPCVATQTGAAKNEVPKGLNQRVLGDTQASQCPPNVGDLGHNNWSMFNPAADNDGFPAGDPRIVQAFLTPYGTFAQINGNSSTVPISDFATFYVTGWTGQGQGFNNPCQGNGDDPVPGNDTGVIVGHFIKYIDRINSGGGTVSCSLSSFGNCVPVLTQ
jgi:hypothetical protein